MYVLRTEEDEREARAHAVARGDHAPILLPWHTPLNSSGGAEATVRALVVGVLAAGPPGRGYLILANVKTMIIASVLAAILGGAVAAGVAVATVNVWHGEDSPVVLSKAVTGGSVRTDDGKIISRAIVRYSIRGTLQEAQTFNNRPCYLNAKVGDRLPPECR